MGPRLVLTNVIEFERWQSSSNTKSKAKKASSNALAFAFKNNRFVFSHKTFSLHVNPFGMAAPAPRPCHYRIHLEKLNLKYIRSTFVRVSPEVMDSNDFPLNFFRFFSLSSSPLPPPSPRLSSCVRLHFISAFVFNKRRKTKRKNTRHRRQLSPQSVRFLFLRTSRRRNRRKLPAAEGRRRSRRQRRRKEKKIK